MKRSFVCCFFTVFLSCTSGGIYKSGIDPDTYTTSPLHDTKYEQLSYSICRGNISEAIDTLLLDNEFCLLPSDLIHEMARSIITQAIKCRDDEEILLGLYAIAISHDEALLPLIEPLLLSRNPLLQLASIRVLSSFQTSSAHTLLLEGLRSDYTMIRLEAAYEVARLQPPGAFEQLESLYWKIEPEAKSLVVSFLEYDHSPHAQSFLKRLLNNEDVTIRQAAILALAAHNDPYTTLSKIDDPDPRIQEAYAFALGQSKNLASRELLEQLCSSTHEEVSLAAAHSLYRLGIHDALSLIENKALCNNLFALHLLSQLGTTKTALLVVKARSEIPDVAVNASMALLARDPSEASIYFTHLFTPSHPDIGIETRYSPGKTLEHLHISSSHRSSGQEAHFEHEARRRGKEMLLTYIADKQPDLFLDLAYHIFDTDQNDLVPVVVSLLELLGSEEALTLLQVGREKIGSPFIRTYCTLGLLRLTKEECYRAPIHEYIKQQDINELLRLRPPVPWDVNVQAAPHTLTLEERSLLFIESLEALARTQDRDAIKQLLRVIQLGNPQNRALLAALLSFCSR